MKNKPTRNSPRLRTIATKTSAGGQSWLSHLGLHIRANLQSEGIVANKRLRLTWDNPDHAHGTIVEIVLTRNRGWDNCFTITPRFQQEEGFRTLLFQHLRLGLGASL